MERLLEKYHPLTKEDVELCSKGSIEAFENGKLTEEYMERLMRFTAMNRHIKHNGLASLPVLQGAEIDSPTIVNTTIPEECDELGITADEYNELKGDYGSILGISVNRYVHLISLCPIRQKPSAVNLIFYHSIPPNDKKNIPCRAMRIRW
jgi:hypothetical protein